MRAGWIVAAVTLVCLLPFADKAFHVDDHRYVDMARQIQRDPGDFFGFTVNLGGSEQLFARMGNNPPFGSFYMAAAALLSGWSEPGLHLVFLLPALLVTLCTAALARRAGGDPLLAALFTLACPAFLVSATSVMASVTMLALFCASVLCWVKGLEEGRSAWLLAGVSLAALCALTKYFGMALIPLLALVAWVRERRLGAWAAWLVVPVAALAAFELYTLHRYGVSPLLRASGYSIQSRAEELGGVRRLLVTVVFAGGVLAPVLFFAPVAFSRRMLVATGLLAAGLFAAYAASWPGDLDFQLHVAFFALAGAALFVLLAAELGRRRDAWTLLLLAWALGSFVFAGFVNYTTNARTLLPMAPPVAILVARRMAERTAEGRAWLRYAPLAPALALSLLVAWGDASLADASREAARRIADRWSPAGRTLWVDGYWGFQHYMRAAGARSIDVRRSVLLPGDVVARHLNSKVQIGLSPEAATLVEEVEVPVGPVTTMALDTGTGFYAIQWGPLPYRVQPGSSYAERFEVRRLDHAVIFETDPEAIGRRQRELDRALSRRALLAALDASGSWRAPEPQQTTDAPDCEPDYPRLAAAVAQRCAWCPTPDECDTCLRAEAARTGVDPSCAVRLTAIVDAWSARCGAWLDAGSPASALEAPLCRAALAVRQELAEGSAPSKRNPTRSGSQVQPQ